MEKRSFRLIVGGISFLILLAGMLFFSMQKLGKDQAENESLIKQPFIPLYSKYSTGFTIQVASFQNKSKAEKLVEELSSKGYETTIFAKDLGAKGIWHRVLVGDFDAKEDAAMFLQKLKGEYKNSFIKPK
ncbi:MAG: SPOR domain-containing protein [Omnitrophica bacterium]|nr:SPOR domain-containing protein [Candidatus Omnitrophota bacterium]